MELLDDQHGGETVSLHRINRILDGRSLNGSSLRVKLSET